MNSEEREDLEQETSTSPRNRTNRQYRHPPTRANFQSRGRHKPPTTSRRMNGTATRGKPRQPRKFQRTVNPHRSSNNHVAKNGHSMNITPVMRQQPSGERGTNERETSNSFHDSSEDEDERPGAIRVYGINRDNDYQSNYNDYNLNTPPYFASSKSLVSELSGADGGKSIRNPYIEFLQTASSIMPCTDSPLIDDNELARIREDAVAAARERIKATAVHAKRMEYNVEGVGERKFCRFTRKALLFWNFILLSVVVLGAGILWTMKSSSSMGPSLMVTEYPSLAPTFSPPEDLGNHICEEAYAVANIGISITGSTVNASVANLLDTCDVVTSNGEFGAWYTVEGTIQLE